MCQQILAALAVLATSSCSGEATTCYQKLSGAEPSGQKPKKILDLTLVSRLQLLQTLKGALWIFETL